MKKNRCIKCGIAVESGLNQTRLDTRQVKMGSSGRNMMPIRCLLQIKKIYGNVQGWQDHILSKKMVGTTCFISDMKIYLKQECVWRDQRMELETGRDIRKIQLFPQVLREVGNANQSINLLFSMMDKRINGKCGITLEKGQ